jgi:hypothetical protein
MRALKIVGLALVASFAYSCGDDVQFADPPKRTPDPNAAPADVSGRMPPGHPPIEGSKPAPAPTKPPPTAPSTHDPFADEGAAPAVDAPKQDPNAVAVAGVITLGEGAVAPSGKFSLFVSLVEGPTGRMPILSKRFDDPKFPFSFELRYADNPTNATVDPSATLHVRAQISTTGDVMRSTHRTTSAAPVSLGSKDFSLALKP